MTNIGRKESKPSCSPPVGDYIHSSDNRYRPVRLDDRTAPLVQPARWQSPTNADGAYHRDSDALGRRPYPARHPDRRDKSRTRFRLLRRYASGRRDFGIAWMGDTFIGGNMAELKGSIEHIVTEMPWLFGLALFVMSILLFSQAATIRAMLPLGIALGISPYMLIALFPAVNGYFFIPNYPTVVAAINFDRTGTTHIGKYVLNHSFMMPGLVATGVSVALGLLMIQLF